MGRKISEHDAQEIARLRREGKSIPEIMEKTGFSSATCFKYCGQKKEKKRKPLFLNTAPWKAHCETCLYAFRPGMESKSSHVVKGCELEIENREKCRLWLDTKRIVSVPEWVDVSDDLPQLMADGISVTVRVRLINGNTSDAYCDENGKWFFTNGDPVPEEYPAIRWRSL